jgi:hypothetical protein
MHIPMKISSETQKEIEIVEEGFLDCGAGGKFINQSYAKANGLEQKPYSKPIPVYNVDGTLNKRGTIKHYVDLNIEIHGRTRKERLMVTGLGKHKIILGYPWLKETNPIIDWEKGTLDWRQQDTKPLEKKPAAITEEEDKEEHLNSTQFPLDKGELALLI